MTVTKLKPMNDNPSGILPTEYKILVAPKVTADKTAGGIILPDDTKHRD